MLLRCRGSFITSPVGDGTESHVVFDFRENDLLKIKQKLLVSDYNLLSYCDQAVSVLSHTVRKGLHGWHCIREDCTVQSAVSIMLESSSSADPPWWVLVSL